MLKNRETYEIMSPETIGLVRQDDAGIVLGKLSGRCGAAWWVGGGWQDDAGIGLGKH